MNIAFSAAKSMSLGNGALVAFIGFIIVLAVLALLVGIFYISGAIFKSKLFNKQKAVTPLPQQTKVAEAAEDETDDALVAVITAAVACMLEEECDGDAPEFVIKRIVRKK